MLKTNLLLQFVE